MGQLDHSTGSLSEQPPHWWSVRGQQLCGPLQCGGRGRKWLVAVFRHVLLINLFDASSPTEPVPELQYQQLIMQSRS